jgi:predicted transcriptional regulator YheO
MSNDKAGASYEVLSPWAAADPKPLKGLSPRLADLAGKKIGLLCNNKRAAPLILDVTERLLKEKYPTAKISRFNSRSFSVSALEPDRKQEFEDWIKGVDAVVASVGD